MLATASLPLAHSAACLCMFLVASRLCDARSRRGASGQAPPTRAAVAAAARQQLVGSSVALLLLCFSLLLKADFSRARQRDGVLSILGTVVVLAGPLVALPTLAPAWWFRHRAALVLATRLAFLLGRNEADPLALYQVFQEPPSVGWLGRVRDFWLLMTGTRGTMLLTMTLVAPLPVLLHVATAVFSFYTFSGIPEEACARPMLQRPYWRRRIELVHNAADRLLPAVPGRARSTLGHCTAFLTFVQLLQVVASTLLCCAVDTVPAAEATETPALAATFTAAQECACQRCNPGASSSTAEHVPCSAQGDAALKCGWCKHGAASRRFVQAIWAEAAASLRHLCGLLTGSAAEHDLAFAVAAWWLLLPFLWLLALELQPQRGGAEAA